MAITIAVRSDNADALSMYSCKHPEFEEFLLEYFKKYNDMEIVMFQVSSPELTVSIRKDDNRILKDGKFVAIAQLDRVSGFEPE